MCPRYSNAAVAASGFRLTLIATWFASKRCYNVIVVFGITVPAGTLRCCSGDCLVDMVVLIVCSAQNLGMELGVLRVLLYPKLPPNPPPPQWSLLKWFRRPLLLQDILRHPGNGHYYDYILVRKMTSYTSVRYYVWLTGI